MSIYYKYAPYGTKIVVLSYVDDYIYWYNFEALGKKIVDTLGKRFHVNFFGYAHWFMSIIISQMKDHYISVDQARYAISIFQNTWILPQLRQVQVFIRKLYHII